jgi:hypothetical protein
MMLAVLCCWLLLLNLSQARVCSSNASDTPGTTGLTDFLFVFSVCFVFLSLLSFFFLLFWPCGRYHFPCAGGI